MDGDAIKALRRELGCTARELANALGLEQETVLAWERGELFPTKQYVEKMEAFRTKGPSAIPKKKRSAPASPMAALAEPEIWRLFRKILAHADLRDRIKKLADEYDDPAE
jgi:transcriptional regulator with XRE-family HTH domain